MSSESPYKSRKAPSTPQRRWKKGFERASALAPEVLKTGGAKRGFAETRILTEWAAVAGEDISAICWPVKVRYGGRGGLGAALVLAVEGARAPEIDMQRARIIERVNAFYGYRAISRIEIDQSRAPELRKNAEKTSHPGVAGPVAPIPDIADDALAMALARLGANVKARAEKTKNAKGNSHE